MKILFLCKFPDACQYYRIDVPAKQLAIAGHQVRTDYISAIDTIPGSGIKAWDVEWADVIIFQRPITYAERDHVAQIKEKRPEKLVVGEYDDDYASVPNWNPGYTYLTAKRKEWESIIPLFDAMICSTEHLKVALSKYNECPIEVIKNAIDFEAFNAGDPLLAHDVSQSKLCDDENFTIRPSNPQAVSSFNEFAKDKPVIAWFGSRTHYCDLDWLPEQLAEVANIHKDALFVFVGFTTWRLCTDLPHDRLFFVNGAAPVTNYYRLLRGLKIDISLCPVDPNTFNESKSSIKYVESCAARFIPVASDFDTYEIDFNKGFLADYRYGSWRDKICEAIEITRSGDAKNELIDSNYKYVVDNFSAKLRTQQYISFFEKMLMEKRK